MNISKKAVSAVVARNRGTFVKSERVTVKAYIEDEWLPTLNSRVKPTTVKQYRQKADYSIELLGNKKIQDLRPLDIEKMKANLLKRGLSPRTVAMAMQVLDMVCKHARDVGQVISVNPCEKVRKPRQVSAKTVKAMTPEQVRSVLSECEGTQWLGFMRLAFFTGARRGELMGLRWSDIDFETGTVTFSTNIVVTDEGLVEQSTKSGRSRVVTLDPDTLAALKAQRKEQALKRLELGQYWQGADDWVTVRHDGSRCTPTAATDAWDRYAKKANVTGFRLHDTRHTHATPRFRDLGDAGSTLGRALSGAVPGDGVLVAVVPNGVPVALAAAGVSGHDVRPLWVDRGPDGVRVREFGNVTDVVHVVVDDGVESGSVARAVAPPLRRAGVREVWLAVPWCPSVLLSELDELFDRVIVLHEAKPNESLASCFEIFDTIDVQTAERLLL